MKDETFAQRLWLDLRALFFWALSVLHFFPVTAVLVALGAMIDPRRTDRLLRVYARTIVRCAGASFHVRRAAGFDTERTCFFVPNHTNLFDPYILYSSIPQFFRGLELESHFRIPVYGWMMKRFGNVPVPDERTPSALREMSARCRATLDAGTSIVVFPEGHRTRDGRVGRFHAGVFRMAREFQIPIVPVSIVGAFDLKRAKKWRLRPAHIEVILHEMILPEAFAQIPEAELREQVRTIVRGPLEAATALQGTIAKPPRSSL